MFLALNLITGQLISMVPTTDKSYAWIREKKNNALTSSYKLII